MVLETQGTPALGFKGSHSPCHRSSFRMVALSYTFLHFSHSKQWAGWEGVQEKLGNLKKALLARREMLHLSLLAEESPSHALEECTFIPSNWDRARRGLSARRVRKDFKPFKSMRLVTDTWWEEKPAG